LKPKNIRLTIYNVKGQEITTLISEILNKGHYSIQWDAKGYASGVYFVRLESDSFKRQKD